MKYYLAEVWSDFTTKVPIFDKDGRRKTAHEGRADFAMPMGLLFLLAGAGGYSADPHLAYREISRKSEP